MFYCLVNYNSDPSKMVRYATDYVIYDRSDDGNDWCKGFKNVIKTENVGHVDYDKLCYLIDNYDNLPEIFFWGKANTVPRHISEGEFEKIKDTKEFMPVLSQEHKTYSDRLGEVCFYKEGMYYERNDSWYLSEHHPKYFSDFKNFAAHFFIPCEQFIPFPPGGNFFLTRERVHRYGRAFYEELVGFLPYCQLPGEAYMAERLYYLLWR